MHLLPQLRKLERAFPRELVVVGVHSPKFTNERSTESLRQAVLRLEVSHPVVSDPGMRVWSEYAIGAWPTVIVVDPAGKVIGKHEGEFRFEEFQPLMADMVTEFDARGMLDRRDLAFEPETPPKTPLLFPGKVLADAASGRLFVADSGHHRIVMATLDGKLLRVVGTEKGFRDGGPTEAAFDTPQGMALAGEQLYVADTGNHAIRRIDLISGQVATLAGTGEQARRVKEGPGVMSALNSPWDLVLHQEVLYIAMAGSHQIWSFDLQSGELVRYAGSGREALVDGPLARATFAQPSGLASDGRRLYVADSESSAVRVVDLPGVGNQVRTLVGQGLFDFGDEDGVGSRARLQHDLGVAVAPSAPPALTPTLSQGERGIPPDPLTGGRGQVESMLYIADSYNHRIKRLNPRTTETRSLVGSGTPALQDGIGASASFWEPGGLSAVPGRLYVADTNNHAVRVVDLASLRVSTLEMEGL